MKWFCTCFQFNAAYFKSEPKSKTTIVVHSFGLLSRVQIKSISILYKEVNRSHHNCFCCILHTDCKTIEQHTQKKQTTSTQTLQVFINLEVVYGDYVIIVTSSWCFVLFINISCSLTHTHCQRLHTPIYCAKLWTHIVRWPLLPCVWYSLDTHQSMAFLC